MKTKVKDIVRHQRARVRVRFACTDCSRTEQSHQEKLCINRIMENVKRTGVIPIDPAGRVPNYGDVSHLNRPYDQLLIEARETNKKLVKYTDEQKEKIRLEKIAKRKQIEADAAAYRASLAAVDKNNSTESQST